MPVSERPDFGPWASFALLLFLSYGCCTRACSPRPTAAAAHAAAQGDVDQYRFAARSRHVVPGFSRRQDQRQTPSRLLEASVALRPGGGAIRAQRRMWRARLQKLHNAPACSLPEHVFAPKVSIVGACPERPWWCERTGDAMAAVSRHGPGPSCQCGHWLHGRDRTNFLDSVFSKSRRSAMSASDAGQSEQAMGATILRVCLGIERKQTKVGFCITSERPLIFSVDTLKRRNPRGGP
jgi:hypothetical protein